MPSLIHSLPSSLVAGIKKRLYSVNLWTKIVIPVVAILALAFGAYTYLGTWLTSRQFLIQADNTAVRFTDTLEQGLRSAMLGHRQNDVKTILASVAELRTVEQVLVLDPTGKPIYRAGHGAPVKITPGGSTHKTERFVLDGSTYRVVKPIKNIQSCHTCHESSKTINGYLVADLSLRPMKEEIVRNRKFSAALGFSTVLLVALAIGLVVEVVARRPLKRLAETMSRVGEGDMSARAPISTYDEIGKLSNHFNTMVQMIRQKNDELLSAERKIAESERLAGIGLLAAGVAHEINNPLAGISMSAEAVMDMNCTPEQRQSFVQMIIDEADTIREIVHRLLALDGTSPAALMPTEVNEVLREALDSCSAILTASGIIVETDLGTDLPMVNAHASQLRQAMANIITNAVQAMPDGGRLSITSRHDGAFLELFFADTGGGIVPSDIARIFDPFFTTKEVGQGFGLGLSVTHEIIRRHGGEISVNSAGSEGTTFKVRLPVAGEG